MSERAHAVAFVGRQIRAGLRDAARRRNRVWLLWVAGVAVAVSVPAVDRSPLQIASLASGMYIALAAVGLNYAVGLAGIPSLGQGGFVGIGAFVAAWVTARWGWDVVAATAAGTAAAAAAGFVVGAGAARLTRVYVAITTWIVAWMLQFALADFPQISGGSQGLALPPARLGVLGTTVRLTPTWHFEIALLLIAATCAMFVAVKRSPTGLHLSALREDEAAALVVGADRARLRTIAVVVSAAIGGVAGALTVQLAGIADPTGYGPLLSVKLFVAVILGGAAFTLGPVIGAVVLALIGPVAHGLGHAAGLAPERFEPLVAAVLLMVALVAGGDGIVARVLQLVRRDTAEPSSRASRVSVAPSAGASAVPGPTTLEARGVSKSFGGVRALDAVDLEVRAGSIHALIGPNGSGKSTLLRILSGSMAADSGEVVVGGNRIVGASVPRLRAAGVARTLQRTATFEQMSARDHVLVGSVTARHITGTARYALATPAARAEEADARADADRILGELGLTHVADRAAARLSSAEQRLLMLAMALAARPDVVLLDEPGAGITADGVGSLIDVVLRVASAGVAVVLVEHNLRLVRATASEVTVLSSGRVVAHGTPEQVAASDEVRNVYTGLTSR